MEKLVDARGKSCPVPVIMTKKEIDARSSGIIRALVDNRVASENIAKLATSLGHSYKTEEVSGEEFHIIIKLGDTKIDQSQKEEPIDKKIKDISLGFSKDIMGSGDETLGAILMKSYIYTVSEVSPYPKIMVFFNTGVNLTCKDSEVLEELIELEKKGVEIISCGTCLDFLGRNEDIAVGSISNMYTIYEKLRETKSNIVL